jgi:glutaminyl-tRNA synthetase
VPINPDSLVVVRGAKVEPSVKSGPLDTRYQFERTGYFWRDPVDGVGDALVFDRIVALKDTWARRDQSDADARATTVVEARAAAGGGRGAQGAPPAAAGTAKQGERRRARTLDTAGAALAERYHKELGVAAEHAEVVAASPSFFEAALKDRADAVTVAAWIAVDLRGLAGDRSLDDLPFAGEAVGRLASLVEEGRISRRAAKDVLARMVEEGGEPGAWIETLGLAKVRGEEALGAAIDAVLGAWPQKVDEYRDGKKGLLGFFVGEVMKKTGGAADPAEAKSLLLSRLPG